MFDVVILAVALSMDAFAVAIGLGAKHGQVAKQCRGAGAKPGQERSLASLAWMAALYFGVFQGLMPLIGYLGGQGVMGWVETYAHWIAFVLLLLIGGKMIYESLTEGIEEDISQITPRLMLILAIATSIDAMAAGFSLTLLAVNAWLSCLMIAVTTFLFSGVGVYIGRRFGTWLESKAELFGGVVLILIGIKMLLM